MKAFLKEFTMRGLMVSAGGPMVLAIIYGILGATGTITHLTPGEVCMGILTITVMAFIAAGMTAIYQVEQLPLMTAILLHAGVLYLDYLLMYLLNRWIPGDLISIGIFTAVFFLGFALIWMCIYLTTKVRTKRLNQQILEADR